MARNIHDTFSKEWMKELLSDFGTVEIETQVAGEVRTIDIVFTPHNPDRITLESIGLLGKIVIQPAALEAFRNAVPAWEVRNCTQKIFQLENELTRSADQKGIKLLPEMLPYINSEPVNLETFKVEVA